MNRRILEKLTESAHPPAAPATRSLHGRESQVGRVEHMLRTTAETHRSGVLVLDSPAGTGKTRLLLEAVSLAGRRGFAVLDSVVDKPRQVSLPTSLSLVSARQGRHGGQETDRTSWITGQFEAQLDGHLRRGPVLVALDDTQWTDPLALRALGALMSKLDSAPVLWLFALRSEDGESANGLLLRSLARGHRAEWVGPLEPLTDDAVADLIGDLLDAVPDEDVLALGESIGGTPQAVVDLVQGLEEEGCVQVADGTARLTTGPLARGITSAVAADPSAHLPRPFLRLVHERLRGLSRQTQEVLQVAAVLGRSFTPHDLAEMRGERPAQLLGPLQEALSAGLVSSHPDEFAFHREPVWGAVLDTVPQLMRSLLHQQAATMLLARAHGGTEAAAVHLVHCTHADDAQAIATIREAAQRLLPTSPQAAAALATRGLEITERGGDDHLALGTTATAALVRAGNLSQAIELAQSLLGGHGENACRSTMRPLRTWLATALMLRGDTTAALKVSQETLADNGATTSCSDPCPELLLLNTLSHNDQTTAVGAAERVLALNAPHSDDVRAAALNVRAMAFWRNGVLDSAFSAIEEAAQLRGPLTSIWQRDPLWTKAWMLTRVRRLDDALSVVDTVRRTIDSERTGVLASVPLALRATILLAKGDLAAAEEDATAGLAASAKAEMPLYEPQLRAVLVVAALRRGDLASASERLKQLEDSAPGDRAHPWWAMHRLLTALVTSARRGAHAAMDEIREVQRDPAKRRQLLLEDPSSTAWSVRTALAADEREIAELIVTTAEEIAADNGAHPTVVAAARHGRALLDGDVKALAGLAELYGDPWAAASVSEDIGALQCETDRDQAIAELNTAMAAYDELGAEWDSARVRRRLRRLGVRRRHWNHETRPETGWGSLTGTEEKVARLVARGLTNRQVASELFVSPHTVGFHLRQIYRKLTIQSRVDLARIAP
ncbi:helix-turn-helix transcriptional regulator [Allokutzneria oryzae]|uniref:LuxR C-terminal-related transcriptional regulator n=1 Tax=Allokutzneria oryzae TaxID=1378989 RepID=A0ABV5ZRH3_9PSEU